MKIGRHARLHAGIALAATLIAVVVGTRAEQQAQDQRTVKAMMQNKTTVCVGRLLIDLPADVKVSFSGARLGSVDINVEPGFTPQKAAAVIAEREASLAGQLNEYERPSLEKRVVADGVNFQATLLYSGREKPVTRTLNGLPVTGEEGITVEAFGIKDDLFYRFKGEGLSSPKYEHSVIELVKKFESLTASSTPSESGFCTENGIIHDPISPGKNETVTMFASIKGHPDIAIRLDTSVLHKPQESLLARDANNDINTRFAANIKNLGKGPRELNGIPGEELLDRFKERNGTTGHMFMWESLGKPSDVFVPTITLELQTGKGRPGAPVNSSLSDEAVLQLWQAISSSLRIRPTTETKKVGHADTVPAVPLGELAATGRTCPQTGYWHCGEPGFVDGEQGKLIRQGDLMPRAVIRGAPGLWQKISGSVQLREVATVWKLIAYGSRLDNERADGNDGAV
ncbi:T6SS immunity protein Tli4 family protein [Massilia sp. 2TAF26]|uniref:T6SS immunity protein Tli4 family protein n=1 Tax=Massilia sp. 2TAF26 TaxID=3233012 RepID=UPI003F985DC0